MTKRIIRFAHVLLVIGALGIGMLIPQFIPDGVSDFTGDERQAAEGALNQTNDFYTGIDSFSGIGTFKRQVVYMSKQSKPSYGMYSRCRELYDVYIADRGIFGITLSVGSRRACIH